MHYANQYLHPPWVIGYVHRVVCNTHKGGGHLKTLEVMQKNDTNLSLYPSLG